MRKLLILLLFPFISLAQDKIDPLPIITDTTGNYNIIDPIQHHFILGWNWGSPGKKLDDALFMNFYHGYPTAGQDNNDDYANNIRISQQLGGDIIGGRLQDVTFNTQSLYLEPTIKVINPNGNNEFFPTMRNREGSVFGFQKRNKIKLINDPLNPDFGRALLYKDSVSSGSAVVLDSIWSNNILRFYNYNNDPIINLPDMNGKEIFISINLKSLETITNANPSDVILTIKLPYKVWNDDLNSGKGGYLGSDFVKFKNLPKVTGNILNDTLQIYGSRGDFRGIRRDINTALNPTPGIKEFQITAGMLDVDGIGTSNKNITLSAFVLFELKDGGIYQWNPLLRPDWFDHGTNFKEYISELDLEVTYHGKLDVAIDWIRLETPRAREIFEGKYDNDVYNSAKAMIDEIHNETSHNPRLFRLYGADELLPQQWGVNRYFNLLLDTLSSSETGLSNNPAGHYLHATGFKEYWTGDNIGFYTDQAVPYVKYSLMRDSAIGLSGADTIKYSESPETLNLKFGYRGHFRRNTHIDNTYYESKDYPINDSLNSDYETFIESGSLSLKTLPFPPNHWPYDSLYGFVAGGHEYYLSSTQFKIERSINNYYHKQSRMLFDQNPWWANFWINSEAWVNYPDFNTYSIVKPGHRPKTGEEISLITNVPVILGAKGLLYWLKTEPLSGNALGLSNELNRQDTSQAKLPSGDTLIYSNIIGGDYIQTPDPFKSVNLVNMSKLRLGLFNRSSDKVYIGIKSARSQLHKLHKWITAVDSELMNLRLQAWYGKGYKSWEVWNQFNSYQNWSESPMRTIVNVDSIRTRKLFEPKYNSNHNYHPNYESKDSSFFDVTLLQDKNDSPNDLYNRKKSVYLGLQNRRTDPLFYRDSNFYQPPGGGGPPLLLPTDWRGELMFFSTAEMDSNVRFGGKDLWGVNKSASWWKYKWWERLGVRELSLPINIPVYGNGTYLIAEELGLEKMDTLGWWFANDLYHRVDTVLNNGDKLLAKLLPGQGKIVKLSYVPYFFNDPTHDEDPTNDTCYFCDIFNDFSKFKLDIEKITTEEGCCYTIGLTYDAKCTFENIPFRLIFNGASGNSFNDLDHPGTLKDSTGTNIKFKNYLMNLDSNTGRVEFGTFCVPNDGNSYKISLLAGKDKETHFIGCDRELQFDVKCGEIVDPKDCCEGLSVSDSMYSNGTYHGSFYEAYEFCTLLKVNPLFDSDCIFGVSLGDGNYNMTLDPINGSPIDFTIGSGKEYKLCQGYLNCLPTTPPNNSIIMMKMQFLGKDGTVICETEVPILAPCINSGLGGLEIIPPGGPVGPAKTSNEKPDSKTYESESFKVTVWPNPTSGVLNVEIDSKVDTEVDINFISNIGANITNENGVTLSKGVNAKTYNLKDYSSGVYYLQINGKDGNIVLPIMLNK